MLTLFDNKKKMYTEVYAVVTVYTYSQTAISLRVGIASDDEPIFFYCVFRNATATAAQNRTTTRLPTPYIIGGRSTCGEDIIGIKQYKRGFYFFIDIVLLLLFSFSLSTKHTL